MAIKRYIDRQFDLFVPFVTDLPLRDQRETMERPFFSLAKRKRLKPIEYTSSDRSVFVNVFPNQEFGMATIWDADVLIWATSTINSLKKQGVNDLPRTLYFQPYDLLKTICRDIGGYEYRRLREALARLQSTSIVTNIRVKRDKKHRQFSWIESWTDLADEETNRSRGMSLTLSEWFYEGVLMDGGLLAIDQVYFSITGGRERWLYRVARKHAGGVGSEGFAIPLPTLFDKSGAEGPYRRFKFEIARIAECNDLPGFLLSIEEGRSEPILRMVRRSVADQPATQAKEPRTRRHMEPHHKASAHLPLFQGHQLTDETIARVRRDFPGWDVYALKTDFDAWIAGAADRAPRNYQAAFYGFVRHYHARNRA